MAGTLGVDSREVARLAAGILVAGHPVADVQVDCQVVLLREVGCRVVWFQVVWLREVECQVVWLREVECQVVWYREVVLQAVAVLARRPRDVGLGAGRLAAEYLDGYRHPVGLVDCLSRALMDAVGGSAGSLPRRPPDAHPVVHSDVYPVGQG